MDKTCYSCELRHNKDTQILEKDRNHEQSDKDTHKEIYDLKQDWATY